MTLDLLVLAASLFIRERGFSRFHSVAGLRLVTRQLELSQPGWFKIPEHQSPRKNEAKSPHCTYVKFSLVPCHSSQDQPGKNKIKSFEGRPNTGHLIDWVILGW